MNPDALGLDAQPRSATAQGDPERCQCQHQGHASIILPSWTRYAFAIAPRAPYVVYSG
jgi:hypothetical protein